MADEGTLIQAASRGAAVADASGELTPAETEALISSEQRFRTLVETAPGGFVLTNAAGVASYATTAITRLMGYEMHEVIGRNIFSFVHPEDMPYSFKVFSEVLRTPHAKGSSEFRVLHKDGSWKWMEAIAQNFLDDPAIASVCCNLWDISARKAAEADRKRVELELVHERNLLRTLIDHIPDYIYIKDTASCYLTTNRANLELIGLRSPEQVHGKSVSDFFPPEIAQPYLDDDRSLFRSGQPIFNREEPIVGRYGEKRWLLTTKVPLHDPSGAITGLVGISRDITERKRSEAALANERNLFCSILDNLPLCVYVLDREQRFLLNNRAHTRLLGLEPDIDVRTRQFMEFAPHLMNELEAADIQSVLENGVPIFDREQVITDPAGRQRVHLASKVPLLGTDGVPRGVICISQDITERQRAREQIEQLAAFPRFNPNPVFAFSPDGGLTYFNAAAQSLTHLLGKSHPTEILPSFSGALVRECAERGEPKLRLETQLGERTVSWSFFPTTSGVVHCYASDITERLVLEAQLRQAQKMECVGQLAGGVAHDFNNLLTVIQGHASLLLGEGLGGGMHESAQQISVASDRAANLTRQLLAFSRRQVLQPRNLDLNDVVATVAKIFQRVLGEDIVFNVRYASNLPPIHADPGMIEQVLLNLVVNARDAMPKGGRLDIVLQAVALDKEAATHHAEARPGTFVMLSVADTGCGIPPENLDRVFEPFFTTKDVGRGTGLGLATVYGVVKQHDGWVSVRSEVGRGTTFDIFLPACEKQALSQAPTVKDAGRGSECILLVEDEDALRELVRCVLENYGYTVIDAPNGRRAYDVWKEKGQKIDMLLTDIVMPDGVTGRDLADALKQEKPNLRVLFSSGYSSDIIGKDFVLADGVNFLQKPYNPHTLAQTVRECLDR